MTSWGWLRRIARSSSSSSRMVPLRIESPEHVLVDAAECADDFGVGAALTPVRLVDLLEVRHIPDRDLVDRLIRVRRHLPCLRVTATGRRRGREVISASSRSAPTSRRAPRRRGFARLRLGEPPRMGFDNARLAVAVSSAPCLAPSVAVSSSPRFFPRRSSPGSAPAADVRRPPGMHSSTYQRGPRSDSRRSLHRCDRRGLGGVGRSSTIYEAAKGYP